MDLELDLNPPQQAAVLQTDGPVLVLAGAGSGKTRVITYRIANLIQQGVHPGAILAVTFTNKAAGEMRERAEALLGHGATGLWIGTFHSICARLLRMYGEPLGLSRNFLIYDDDDTLTLIRQVMADQGHPERLVAPKEVRWQIDAAKNKGIGPGAYNGAPATLELISDVVGQVYKEYERRLLAADAADFGNLLLKAVELLRQEQELAESLSERFQHVLVDEFQDTNSVQYELVRLLSGRHHNLCVVGDDDQSIYGWRGADIQNILGFEKDHPDAAVIKLEQNYRSTQVILDAAGAVIDRNVGRKAKRLWTDKQGGEKIVCTECEDDRAEAQTVVSTIQLLRNSEERLYGDFAVFYRTHAQSRVLEEALNACRPPIPYAVVGGIRFYDRAEIKNLVAYLRLLVNPADEVSLLRIINVPTRGIGSGTVEKVSGHARARRITLFEAARECAAEQGDGALVLRAGPRKKLGRFITLMDELAELYRTSDPSQAADEVLQRTGYLERLAIDGSPEARNRSENLMELVGSLQDYERRSEEPNLIEWLEQVALASNMDTYSEQEGQVTLMTVHSAKGLEFPVVTIVGLEQGIFPHQRSLNDRDQMEEERRLAYVALTRARERLYLSYAARRWVYNQPQCNPPSDFLHSIPPELICSGVGQRARTSRGPRYGRRGYGSGAYPASRRPAPRPAAKRTDEVWVDTEGFDQRPADDAGEVGGFSVGMQVKHATFGLGEIRVITGSLPNLNLTIFFPTVGAKTIRSQFVQPS
jgi:ATP-dependent DNA helicase UvrD/PcrA